MKSPPLRHQLRILLLRVVIASVLATLVMPLAHSQQMAARFLTEHCSDCHGSDIQEAGIRFDMFDVTNTDAETGRLVDQVLGVLRSGRMPPEDAEQPSADKRGTAMSLLERRLSEIAVQLRSQRQAARNRRLTVEEYNFTMQSLFEVDAEFGDLIPPDPMAETGYLNDSARLGLSSLQMEAYVDSARRAVDRYVQFGANDDTSLRYHIEFEDLFYGTADRYATRKHAPQPIDFATLTARQRANRAQVPVYVEPLAPKFPGAYSDDEKLRPALPKLNQQYVAFPQRLPVGEMLVRIRAAGTHDRVGRFPRMRLEAGITLGDGCSIDKRIVGEVDVDAPLATPKIYEFRIRLEDVPTKGPQSDKDSFDRLSVFDMDQLFISNITCDKKAIFALGRGGYSDPETGSKRIAPKLEQMRSDHVALLHLDSIEVEMLPGDSNKRLSYRWRIPLPKQANAEPALARSFLQEFMTAAYRRPVSHQEVDRKLLLFDTMRAEQETFEQALREAAAAVLVSPAFLFRDPVRPSDQNQPSEDAVARARKLASRLSYFLWLSPPDSLLQQTADDGSLMEPTVLRSQTQRMLDDPRCNRMLDSFCRQWLRLDRHHNIAVSRDTYPTWDEDLAELTLQETVAFFKAVFETNASAIDLLDAKYAILNDRLASHYDLPRVPKGNLHRVQLPPGSERGGLLTQASILTMNSDGVDSHPVRRGVWLLDRILNNPPPPPPPNVSQIDEDAPNFRGLTLKERIEVHRRPGACHNCHQQIDPWGIPFESFDATGKWRESVESRSGDSHPIDPSAMLPDQTSIHNARALKAYLRDQRSDDFARALANHWATYALGRRPDFADREPMEVIHDKFVDSGYQLRELLQALVESPLFQE